ncbi:MAG: hypothetical protein JWO38_4763 [Gemmataceae bacterium]|nr:hypothetical protein [Gemmataceae bacterium]
MVRKVLRAALCAALGLGIVSLSVETVASAKDKKDEKLPDIPAIMKKAHAKTDGYLDKIAAEAKAGKWEDAETDAKSLVLAGEALGKNTPPKGDAKPWEKLSAKYVDSAKAVADATEKKDAKAVTAALGTIRKSCGACHSAHKGK